MEIDTLNRNLKSGDVYCTYEMSKALFKLGFNLECNASYSSPSELWLNTDYSTKAPTLSSAQTWLRNVKNLNIQLIYSSVKNEWVSCINIHDFSKYIWKSSYEYALAYGIVECIEFLLNDK